MRYQVIHGDNTAVLKTFPDNYFDSIVTDPPYGIDFLGKEWDATTGALETYQECLRVLKPGGYLLAFSAARTYHHLAVTVEQAGFEIRDQIMWIYSSGFPKSQDIGRQLHKKEHGRPDKQRFDPAIMIRDGANFRHPDSGVIYRALPDINGDKLANSHEGTGYGVVYEEIIAVDNPWSGWGTCLKPAHEPIVMARKPTRLSFAENVQQWGMGALNIDAGRVPFASEDDRPSGGENGWSRVGFGEQPVEKYKDQKKKKSDVEIYLNNKRGPVERSRIQDGAGIGMFEGQVGYKAIKRPVTVEEDLPAGRFPSNVIGEISEPYQKYFYCPKIKNSERHIGHTANEDNPGNNHPTVKPIELMKYLIRLVTPAGGHVLDPFNGSGSTGCAAVEMDYAYTGIELDANYVDIARRRIEAWYQQTHATTFGRLFE